jgi:hypothetical protein
VYSITHQQDISAGESHWAFNGGGGFRGHINYLLLGSDQVADQAGEYTLLKGSDIGTGGTTLQIEKLDPLSKDNNLVSHTGGDYSVKPTAVANTELLMIGLHQNATFEWEAEEGGEIISETSGAQARMILDCITRTASGQLNSTMWWYE